MNSSRYPKLSRRVLPVVVALASVSTVVGVARTSDAAEEPLPPIQWLITEEPDGIRWTSTGGSVEPMPGDENTQTPVRIGSATGVRIRSQFATGFVTGGQLIMYQWEARNVSDRPQSQRFQQPDAANSRVPSDFTLLAGEFGGDFGFRLIASDGSAGGPIQILFAPEGFENGMVIPAFDVLLRGSFADAQFISGVTTPVWIGQRVGGVPKAAGIELTLHGTASLTVDFDGADGVDVPIAAEQTNASVFQGETHFTDVVLSTANPSATERQLIRDTYAITPTIPDGYELADATCSGGTDNGSLADGTLSVAVEPRQDVTCTLTVDPIDSDADGVDDANDNCPGTVPGDAVDNIGCSIAQLVPCDADWTNHGEYVNTFARISNGFVQTGIITNRERAAAVRQAAHSDCGSS